MLLSSLEKIVSGFEFLIQSRTYLYSKLGSLFCSVLFCFSLFVCHIEILQTLEPTGRIFWYCWKALGEECSTFIFMTFGPILRDLLNSKMFMV